MRREFTPMEVKFVGTVSNVVNKSGTYCDNSSQFESKTYDAGSGNCEAPNQNQ